MTAWKVPPGLYWLDVEGEHKLARLKAWISKGGAKLIKEETEGQPVNPNDFSQGSMYWVMFLVVARRPWLDDMPPPTVIKANRKAINTAADTVQRGPGEGVIAYWKRVLSKAANDTGLSAYGAGFGSGVGLLLFLWLMKKG